MNIHRSNETLFDSVSSLPEARYGYKNNSIMLKCGCVHVNISKEGETGVR